MNIDCRDIGAVDQKEVGVSRKVAADQKVGGVFHMVEADQMAEEADHMQRLLQPLEEEEADSMSKVGVALLVGDADALFPIEKFLKLIQKTPLGAELFVCWWEFPEDFS